MFFVCFRWVIFENDHFIIFAIGKKNELFMLLNSIFLKWYKKNFDIFDSIYAHTYRHRFISVPLNSNERSVLHFFSRKNSKRKNFKTSETYGGNFLIFIMYFRQENFFHRNKRPLVSFSPSLVLNLSTYYLTDPRLLGEKETDEEKIIIYASSVF